MLVGTLEAVSLLSVLLRCIQCAQELQFLIKASRAVSTWDHRVKRKQKGTPLVRSTNKALQINGDKVEERADYLPRNGAKAHPRAAEGDWK